MTIITTTGSRIEQARVAKNMSGSQLARRIGVKAQTLANWENDRSEPRAEKLLKLSGILQVPLIWLLTGETPEASKQPLNLCETSKIAQKMEHALSLQKELAALLLEVSADVARLQEELDEDESLAA